MKTKPSTLLKEIQASARAVDWAWFQHLQGELPEEAFLDLLLNYQTPEGGFGSGLEPDCLNPNPSPIQTWWALHYLMQTKVAYTHPMHLKIYRYLKETMQHAPLFFTTQPSNNDYPHAVWWHYDEKTASWGYNPSIALWAYMVKAHGD